MAVVKVRVLHQALVTKGFEEQDNDHKRYFLLVGGRRTAINTKVSHGEREIGDKLAGLMARQLFLSRREFDQLIDCTLGYEAYLTLLRARQRLPEAPRQQA